MVQDPGYVPGLTRPISVSEYATLTEVREAEVFAGIRTLKIRAAFSRGQWYVEAPQNCEARLAQLRAKQPESIPDLISWLGERPAKHEQTKATSKPERAHPEAPAEPELVVESRGYRLSELPRSDRIEPLGSDANQHVHLDSGNADKPAVAENKSPVPKARKNKLTWRGFGALAASAWLMGLFVWGAITPSQRTFPNGEWDTSSIIGTVFFGLPAMAGVIFLLVRGFAPVRPKPRPLPAAAEAQTAAEERPQPVDYGLTYDDLNLYDNFTNFNSWCCRLDDGNVIRCRGTRLRPDEKYKKGRRWFCILPPFEANAYKAGGFAFWALLFGGLMTRGKDSRLVGFILVGFGLACVVCAIVPGVLLKRLRARASPGLIAYWQAVDRYDKERAAAEKAAREAARDAELRKRSYWAFLDGYEFERATAEVMQKHQFTAMVTPGSGDGGVDIQVTRNGLRGVVQCKAHVACVGPHVVRDLYGVIHHFGADFGIIVSRGGFTRGAIDFARDKPILFLDTDDLIAMQEGRDVLREAFAPKRT